MTSSQYVSGSETGVTNSICRCVHEIQNFNSRRLTYVSHIQVALLESQFQVKKIVAGGLAVI